MTPTQNPPESNPESSKFPIPFSLEDFRKDIANVFLHHVRAYAWMAGEEAGVRAIPGMDEEETAPYGLFFQGGADDIGLTYEQLRHTPLAKVLEFLYRYAYFGELDANTEAMEDGSIHTFITALVSDAAHGGLAQTMDEETSDGTGASAERCLMVCELANARRTLEGGDAFYARFDGKGRTDAVGFECLTVRQMALLAGMEEMSIRAAANKTQKRANPLETYSADGGTRIALDVAKAWLQSKGRYVPITRCWSAAEFDLAKAHFKNLHEFGYALKARLEVVRKRIGEERVAAALESLGLSCTWDFVQERIDDKVLAGRIAELLELPVALFILRCREVAARDALGQAEFDLREALASGTNDPQS